MTLNWAGGERLTDEDVVDEMVIFLHGDFHPPGL